MSDELLDGSEAMAPVDDGGVELTCEKCGRDFQHEGRGRRPKRCPDCRTARSSSTREDTAPRRPRGIDSLESNLHGQLTLLGAGLLFIDTFDGTHLMKNAAEGAKVLSNLAATNPTVRKGLEKGVELAGYGPVLLWGAKLALPIMAHHGVIRGVPDPAQKGPVKPAAATDGVV